MHKFSSFLLSLLSVTAALPALAQQTLTNSDIVKMQSAGLGDGIIISTVNAQPASYDTSVAGLIALKQASVSDSVVAAMISRSAASNAGGVSAVSSSLPATTKVDALTGVDEIGVYYQDKNKAWRLIPSEAVNTKTGGVLKRVATDGIIKGDVNGHIKGAESQTRLSADKNILLYMPDTYTASDYTLVRLHRNSNNREFRAVTGGVFHSSGGATKDSIEFASAKLAPHMYQITFLSPLAPGEYGVLPPGEITTTNLAAHGKIFSFSITE